MAKDLSALETKLREGRSKIDSIELVLSILEFRNNLVKPAEYLPQSLLSTDGPTAIYIFLSRYIIAIVRDFAISPADYDIILAAYGFLDGYEYPEVQKRHIQYCQNIAIHKRGKDIPLNMHWSADDIDRSLNAKENSAIKKLAKRLEIEKVKKGGVLDYIAEAEKLIGAPFPPPNYLLGKGYRKCEIENKVFYVPLTEKEYRSLTNISAKEATLVTLGMGTDDDILSEGGVKANEPENNQPEIESRITTEGGALDDAMPPPKADERTGKALQEPKKRMPGILRNGIEKVQLLILSSGITIVCVILALTVYNHSSSEKTVFSGDVSVKEHGTLEVDSIEILNRNIYLAPGTDAYLEMNIDPDSVQREDLEYNSSDRTVVTTKKHHIIAHEGWQEDAGLNIVITVQGGLMAEDKAYVTVINPDGTDIQQGAKGDGTSDDDSSGFPN